MFSYIPVTGMFRAGFGWMFMLFSNNRTFLYDCSNSCKIAIQDQVLDLIDFHTVNLNKLG